STIARDLEIQARLQPFNRSQTVTAASAVAIRVGRAIVEVDVGSGSNPLLYVNHRRTSANTLRLPGGASLQRGSVPYELGNPFKFPGVTVRWPDGTAIGVYSALGELSFWVEVAPDRVGHLTGLLGDAGVPAAQQFRGRDGTPYTYPRALQESGPLLYRFGASWRIKQRESLFTYARGKSTRSYTILHFPKLPFDEGVVPLAKAVHAETLCREAGITNQEVLQSCEYDILVTGNQHYAAADGLAQSILDPGPSGAPPPTTPPAPPAPSGPPVPTPIDLGAGGNPPAVAYDPVSGDTYVAWLNAAKSGVEVCTVPSGSSVCNHGAGPYQLSNSLAATAVNPLYENVRLVILPGGTVVAVAAVDGANQKVDPNPEYAGVTAGVFAWSSSAGGEHFGADNGEKLLASDQAGDGAMPGNGAVALSATQIGVYGNAYPFGSGFTDFSLKTPAPVPTPVPDVSGNYGDQADTTGGQLASVPGAGGKYIVVAVGGAPNPPSGCPAGPAIGYGEAVNTAPLLAKEPWGAQFFKPLACEAIAPVLAGGGPSGGSIGLLYEAGPGLSGAGADGIYYRSYSTAAMAFGGPVLVSEETSLTLLGAEQLSLSKDGGEGVYAAWNDSRGLVLAYSSNGGATWQPPVQTGLNSYPGFNAGSSVIAGIGGGQAAIAYAAGGQDYLDFFVY
ncbi:MAG TPA: hypothetical protein VKG62_07850, partial [Solirubrobacteraceae bacterium]|nr:hypothetical protein [Solirubrobacteraceae bacterium]